MKFVPNYFPIGPDFLKEKKIHDIGETGSAHGTHFCSLDQRFDSEQSWSRDIL